MSDIDALRQRVEAAERSFGLISARERNYSTRLIDLIGGIEEQLQRHKAELAERDARESARENENRELRAMLQSLLKAVEDGRQDRVGDAINDMDHRITALVAGEPAEIRPPDGDDALAGPAVESPGPTAESAEVERDDEEALMPHDDDIDLEPAGSADPDSQAPDDPASEIDGSQDDADQSSAPDQADAGLGDPLPEVVAEAADSEPSAATDHDDDAEPNPGEPDCEDGLEHEDVLASLGLADVEIPEPDDAPDGHSAAAESPSGGATEGSDVVMADGVSHELSDQGPADEFKDPALVERAEKIALLLSSGDDSDPSVKDIIDRVTELASTLGPDEQEAASEDIDPSDDPNSEADTAEPASEAEQGDVEIPDEVTAA